MPTSQQYQPILSYNLTATIVSGQTASGEIDLSGNTLCGVFLPAGFDGTSLAFEAASESGAASVPVYDGEGSAISRSVAASRYVALNPSDFAGIRFLKLIAGTAQSGGDSLLTLAVRPV